MSANVILFVLQLMHDRHVRRRISYEALMRCINQQDGFGKYSNLLMCKRRDGVDKMRLFSLLSIELTPYCLLCRISSLSSECTLTTHLVKHGLSTNLMVKENYER